MPLSWGITADGYVAFADDAELLKGACGKSLASFPEGEKSQPMDSLIEFAGTQLAHLNSLTFGSHQIIRKN